MQYKVASIEVFQDMSLTFPADERTKFRESLQKCAGAPWRRAVEKEKKLTQDVMVFERAPEDGIPACGLVLWGQPHGYDVVNIVPQGVNELSVTVYNNVLDDFLQRIVKPASYDSTFQVKLGKREQCITDWTSQEAANALHRFSVTANKSTGSSHPSDRSRWFEFLFAVHRAGGELDTVFLGRWLHEVEGWPREVVDDLVIEYESGLALLTAYDRSL